RANTAAMLRHQFLRGFIEKAAAPAGDPQVGAEREVSSGDFLAEAGAAAGDQDAFAFEEAVLEHARSNADGAPIVRVRTLLSATASAVEGGCCQSRAVPAAACPAPARAQPRARPARSRARVLRSRDRARDRPSRGSPPARRLRGARCRAARRWTSAARADG